jgi:hypothetical protein
MLEKLFLGGAIVGVTLGAIVAVNSASAATPRHVVVHKQSWCVAEQATCTLHWFVVSYQGDEPIEWRHA